MTPQARVQAAIELLDSIIAAARDAGPAADTIIARYFQTRRYAGSKDRRAVRELVYRAIRRCGERPPRGRAAMLRLAQEDPALIAAFDGSRNAPAPPEEDEPVVVGSIVPGWLGERLARTVGLEGLPALLGRAPLDVRVNRLKATREDIAAELPEAVPAPHAPDALRLPEGTAVEKSPLWAEGKIEVQDEGSQLLALACNAAPQMLVVDLCAGAGGKTLALAAAMADRGRIVAADVDRARLSRLSPRAERAGATIIETRLLDPNRERAALADLASAADVVLIDAPCSGTGTWRRNPEARWRLTPERLDRLVATQARLIDIGAALVRPGGHLIYAVCSLLDDEGRAQMDRAAVRLGGWVVDPVSLPAGRPWGSGHLLTPAADGTDGFFVARLRAPC